MPLSHMNCPSCGAELTYDSRMAHVESGGKIVCPYEGLAQAELRAMHDRIYFGPWRRIEAASTDVRRAYSQLGRHLSAIGRALAGRDLPAARRDLLKATLALEAEDPSTESSTLLRNMDHALSYAHRAIDELLHDLGLPPHAPMDFAPWYDAGEVPFRDAW